ncbi:alpha/beta fold hydrolase [Leptobacterium flavescens]|uniref:Alpha/beta fold hydrolase n=1 Tax=Leptobacterium flavescens TaxID=472055 RepID=A0A6P0UPX8_9FLAO|nr:alpha/beta fold hydrolase [Leptobacterium flavescens]NER15017.1 alpha/beta fold hydrolase [Leptobacterium flavescens]
MKFKFSSGIVVPIILGFLFPYQSFSQNGYNIVSEGNTIHFKTFGKGEPVLIINGGPGMNSEGFVSLAGEIGNSNMAIIYDQRGTGKSKIAKTDTSTLTMDLMVEDMEILRKHLKIDQWVILGHSFGGMLASYYSSKHPGNVKGLILSSSGGVDLSLLSTLNITSRLSSKERDSLNYWAGRIARGDTTYHALLQRGKYLAPAYLYDKSFVNAVAKRLTQGNSRINQLIWQDLRSMDFDCKEQLKNFSKPVLIIQGENDIIHKSVGELSHSVFKNSELVFLPDAAHYGWLEQPELYFGRIGAFLKSLEN